MRTMNNGAVNHERQCKCKYTHTLLQCIVMVLGAPKAHTCWYSSCRWERAKAACGKMRPFRGDE